MPQVEINFDEFVLVTFWSGVSCKEFYTSDLVERFEKKEKKKEKTDNIFIQFWDQISTLDLPASHGIGATVRMI